MKHTLNIEKVFFSLLQKSETRTQLEYLCTSSHLLSNLLHLSRQLLLRGTDWIFSWMFDLLGKSLMGWSQWQNSYSNLTGPEIWFLTCIISSLNFLSGKVIPKCEPSFPKRLTPSHPSSERAHTTCNRVWCPNLPAIWNPTTNSYHGTGSIFWQGNVAEVHYRLRFYNPLKCTPGLWKKASHHACIHFHVAKSCTSRYISNPLHLVGESN